MHTFNTLASMFVYMNVLIQEETGKGTAGVRLYTRQMVGVVQDAGSQLRHEKKANCCHARDESASPCTMSRKSQWCEGER